MSRSVHAEEAQTDRVQPETVGVVLKRPPPASLVKAYRGCEHLQHHLRAEYVDVRVHVAVRAPSRAHASLGREMGDETRSTAPDNSTSAVRPSARVHVIKIASALIGTPCFCGSAAVAAHPVAHV